MRLRATDRASCRDLASGEPDEAVEVGGGKQRYRATVVGYDHTHRSRGTAASEQFGEPIKLTRHDSAVAVVLHVVGANRPDRDVCG